MTADPVTATSGKINYGNSGSPPNGDAETPGFVDERGFLPVG